ncbi:hypothetical protein N7532_010372 [Penicillium argentinense]|uniref:Uncharacterized protein n=1 Tax=Penicillium argentinense TaxID=1131581 RepID=A0A9W9EPR6_9EURO|nr:uncharacterized protein N7532_010372 [Penicillium argentinense]KAJ5085601.1 hypothetical protein N7532_010372 [Penicillium argentinense]
MLGLRLTNYLQRTSAPWKVDWKVNQKWLKGNRSPDYAKDEYLKKPVLWNVTTDGPQDVPLYKERFCELLLLGIVTIAGYSKSVTVYRIRKYLGSVIEGGTVKDYSTLKKHSLTTGTGKHISALVSQIYRHKSAGIYPKEYLLFCSFSNTVSAVLGEEEQSNHNEYF